MAKSVFGFLSRPVAPMITGSQHVLRLPRYADYAQWYRLRTESRAFLQPWEPTWSPEDLTQAAFRQRVVRNEQEHASGQAVPLFIFEADGRTLLGGLTIGHIRRGASQACMIGYWTGLPYARRGHMRAALELAIHYIFDELGLHRIEAACIPDNDRSLALLEKAGFQREGLLRSYLKIDGAWRDHMILSLLCSDRTPNRNHDF
jgi:[ribosomal protein S5]-alanine N-acetyltransferase